MNRETAAAGTWNESLSEFQKQLDQAIEAPGVSTDAFVAMLVDDQRWLLDLAHLSEVSVLPDLSQTGRCPAWVLGIGSFRGQVHTVLDMRKVLVGEKTPAPLHAWATPLHERWAASLALLWPQMQGLMSKSELSAVPASVHLSSGWEAARWKDQAGQEWKEFDVEKLVSSEYAGLESL